RGRRGAHRAELGRGALGGGHRAHGVGRGAPRGSTRTRPIAREGVHLAALRNANPRLLQAGAGRGPLVNVWQFGVGALGGGLSALALRYRALVNGPFEPTRYVWSRGLGLLCDHNGGVEFVKRQRGGRRAQRFAPGSFDQVKDGDLVWVRLIALPQF